MPHSAPHYSPHKGVPRKSNDNAKARQRKRTYATYSRAWRAIRAEQLAIEPLCRECRKNNRLRPATQVDHIDGDASNNTPDNLQSLCAPHHSQKTARENGGFGRERR